MNKFILLTKNSLLNSFNFGALTHGEKDKKSTGYILLAVLAVLVTGIGGTLSYFYIWGISEILVALNAIHLLPSLLLLVASLMTFFTSIYKAPGTLFGFKDYDVLMSLPVKTSTVIGTKIWLLYSFHIFIDLIILIPGGIVYTQALSPSPVFWVYYIPAILAAPFVPMVLGTVVGMVVTLVASRFKKSTFMTILLTFLLLLAILYFSSGIGNWGIQIENNPLALLTLNKQLSNMIHSVYPLTIFFTGAMSQLRMADFLFFMGISIGVFLIFCAVVGKFFQSMHTFISTKKTAGNYKMQSLKTSGVVTALYKRELKRYFSSSVYVFNTASIILMLIIGTVLFLLKGPDLLRSIPEIPMDMVDISLLLEIFIPLLLSLFAVGCCTTSSSLSMEGNTLWILKSLPVTGKQIIRAKIMVNLTLLLPCVFICAVALMVFFPAPTIWGTLLYLALPVIMSFLVSYLGMYCNLLWPKLNWNSEASAIKRSLSVTVTSLTSVLLVVVIISISLISVKEAPHLAKFIPTAVTAVSLVITIVLKQFINTKGAKKFDEIEV